MRVLAIDTVGPVIGVALRVGDDVRVRTERVKRGSESRLVPWVQELCADAGLRLADLDGVAASHGPGAFTGLRVGLATAAGLAHGAGVPLWTASSLRTRAYRAGPGPVLAALDARKGRVYAGAWDGDRLLRAQADLPPAEAAAWLQPGWRLTGQGAIVFADVFGIPAVPDAEHPAVDALAELGAAALARGEGSEPWQVQPVYLREPDAVPPRT